MAFLVIQDLDALRPKERKAADAWGVFVLISCSEDTAQPHTHWESDLPLRYSSNLELAISFKLF